MYITVNLVKKQGYLKPRTKTYPRCQCYFPLQSCVVILSNSLKTVNCNNCRGCIQIDRYFTGMYPPCSFSFPPPSLLPCAISNLTNYDVAVSFGTGRRRKRVHLAEMRHPIAAENRCKIDVKIDVKIWKKKKVVSSCKHSRHSYFKTSSVPELGRKFLLHKIATGFANN